MTAPTADAGLRRKALSILREGRLQLLHVRSEQDRLPHEVVARVLSSRPGGSVYVVDLLDGVWTCTCLSWQAPGCAHRLAAQIVTGYGQQAMQRPGADAVLAGGGS